MPAGVLAGPPPLPSCPGCPCQRTLQPVNKAALPELLAPVGEKDAAYAAFENGADAVYLGLPGFSARAEAVNLTPEELSDVTGYAHSLTPPRRVYVAVNTLVSDSELQEVTDTIATAADIGVDALIVQDLGVFRIAHRFFPRLRIHASTQMAIHNLAGAKALADLGFARVVLARELTLPEIRRIAADCGIETEVFVHGALCYSYSGLCLYSALFRGRSGNRGRCAYPCRDSFRCEGGASPGHPPPASLPFSMKDLALAGSVDELVAAGVSSLKIEGRKKSPLYVAAVTRLYSGILRDTLSAGEQSELEGDLKTIFSRPWTSLYIHSARQSGAVDPDFVGHRGMPLGSVQSVVSRGRGPGALRFTPSRSVERHDGLQLDLPGQDRPFGFAVVAMRLIDRGRPRDVFEAPAGAQIEVDLPPDAPQIPAGTPLYLSSSQAVKRKYRFTQPRPGEFRVRTPVSAHLEIRQGCLCASLQAPVNESADAQAQVTLPTGAPLNEARDTSAMNGAARKAFEKLGDTSLRLADFKVDNPHGLFVPISLLNELRRSAAAALETRIAERTAARAERILAAIQPPAPPSVRGELWSVKVDRIATLAAFESRDFDRAAEVIVDIELGDAAELAASLAQLAERAGRERIRVALPMVTRAQRENELVAKIAMLRTDGWNRWEAANLSALTYLRTAGGMPDVTSDWPVYIHNRSAAAQLSELGVRGVVLSPEDGIDNLCTLAEVLRQRATIVIHQEVPLFTSESCAFASANGGCPGRERCRYDQMDLVSDHGEKVTVINRNCRTIVLSREARDLSHHLARLRAAGAQRFRVDFMYRQYDPQTAVTLWRTLG